MPPQIRLRTEQITDFAAIRETPVDRLNAIADRFQTPDSSMMQPKELHREISQILGNKPDAAKSILRTLLSLHALIHQRRLSADDVVEAVRIGLESAEPSWEEAEMERWRSVEASFKRLLIAPVVRLVSTALDLMFEYQNLLQSARVITDIRPVFSEDAAHVEGSVVSHTLRIHYDSTGGNHSISIAMDENDLRDLEKQCQRALLKAKTARTLMEEKADVLTVISGDDGNEEA